MATDVSVLVVGAGPTGLLLAIELCRRGVNCRVIDAHAAPLHWDRATVVHPRSLEIFDSLGIIQPLLDSGVKQRTVSLMSAGKVLGKFDLAQCGSRYGFNIGISEEVTESILTDCLREHGGEVVRSARLVKLAESQESVMATIDIDGKTDAISANWVVGCDGYHSATRNLCGIELEGHDIAEPWAVFDATLQGWFDSYEANYAYLDEIPTILTALPQQRWRVYLRPSSSESDMVSDATTTLRRYLPDGTFIDVANPMRFYCHSKFAKQFRSGRVFLAGDAAHVCSPAQGHGMNSGLQDAFNLGWKLALVCQGKSSPALLDSYEMERRPVASKIVTSGDTADRSQFARDAAARHVRDDTLHSVFADPALRQQEVIEEAELNISYADSFIAAGHTHPSLSPGERLPNTIKIHLASREEKYLSEVANSTGHTALIVGASSVDIDELTGLRDSLNVPGDKSFVDTSLVLTARPDGRHGVASLSQSAVKQLGVDGMTLLVIRPDGHIGLRADRDYLDGMTTYQALLASGGQ